MIRFAASRAAAAVVTLGLLSLLVFACGHLLPGDAARSILGPLADARAVAALDRTLGADRAFWPSYVSWLGGVLRGNLGLSYAYRAPVAPIVLTALARSIALAAVTLAIVVPLSAAAGLYAAYREGSWQDRLIGTLGLSLTIMPEFVSGIGFILLFGVAWPVLPVTAMAPAGAGLATRIWHLVMPALPMVLILFGYLARTMRAAATVVLHADYIRTARLKGLPPGIVLWRHVLPNAVPPFISALAGQASYLIGGLVVVESLFRWPGIGRLILAAAHAKDYPMLEAGIMASGAAYLLAAWLADLLAGVLDPRIAAEPAEAG